MPTLSRTLRTLLLVGGLVGTGGVGAAAEPAPTIAPGDDQAASIAACEAAMLAEMQARHPDAVEVQALEDQMSATETPGGQTEVKGGGQLALEVGQWTPFSYTCAFSTTTGQVTRLQLP